MELPQEDELSAKDAKEPRGAFGDTIAGIGRENAIYERRFTTTADRSRAVTWRVLSEEFFQPLIGRDRVVVDIGAGDGHFLRSIDARHRIAVDVSPHSLKLRDEGIEVLHVPATEFTPYLRQPADVVFMSNFLEHLLTKRQVLDVLEECYRALRPRGTIIVLQPNIRYVGAAYWDFIDHHIALTEKSLVEALEVCGFSIERVIPRFLPYTVKSALGLSVAGKRQWLVRVYLKLPFLWRIFGQQTLVVASKGPS